MVLFMIVPMLICIKWLHSSFATALWLGLFIWLFPVVMDILFDIMIPLFPEGAATAVVSICFLVLLFAGYVFGIYFILRICFGDPVRSKKYAVGFVGYVFIANILVSIIF